MAKKKETNKKPIVETKQKIDNSIEIQPYLLFVLLEIYKLCNIF